MAKTYHKCSVCGKNTTHKYKLPHGTIHVCGFCKDQLNYIINDKNIPVVWVGIDDFKEHESACKEACKLIDTSYEIAYKVGTAFQDYIWDTSFGQVFSEALKSVGGRLEKQYVLNTPANDLLLIPMESLKSEAAQACLESRLKGCEPDLTSEL